MNLFVCGSFGSQTEEDQLEELLGPCSTLKRATKKNRDRDSKNPYANRGLDKFYALLAELEDKKQKIYTQKGSGDISLVRFVYSNSNNWKPIVVVNKLKKDGRKKQQTATSAHDDNAMMSSGNNYSEPLDKYPIESTATVSKEVVEEKKMEVTNKMVTWRRRLGLCVGDIRCPFVYLPVMIILILLFLAVYGKAFAVVCTSVSWYLLPIITASKDASTGFSCPPSKRPKKINNNQKKKEYARRYSEKSIVRPAEGSSSPTSVLVGPPDEKSPVGKHAHQLSW